jgi:conjugative transfer region protein TrbK
MNIAGQDTMAAVIVLVGALLATVIALSSHSDPSAQPAGTERAVSATTALDIDLARCRALGPDARDDAACQRASRIVSRRFFEYGELRYGLAVDPASETPGQEVAAARLRGEPTGARKAESRPDAVSLRSAADVAGQPR